MAESKEEREARLNQKTSPEAVPAAGPKVRWKGDLEFRHDLARLKTATMQKNVSYKKYVPQLEPVEHEHFFHSVDMKGKANRYCQAVGGHFHEVEIDWNRTDKDGNPRVKCGPALREVDVRTRSGKVRKRIEKVRFASGVIDGDMDGGPEEDDPVEVSYVHDEHVHESVYMDSEMISPNRMKRQQSEDRNALAGMIKAQPSLFKGDGAKANEGTSGADDRLNETNVDGATIREE